MSNEREKDNLNRPKIGSNRVIIEVVDSTNNYVADLLSTADLEHGTVVLAYEQTAGRGQEGNKWESTKGKDLSVSYYLRPQFMSADEPFVLNKAIAVGLRNTIAFFSGMGDKVKVKWPNDILINRKKVAGILIEASWQGSVCTQFIVGIGINLNSAIAELPSGATSILTECGKQLDILNVLDHLSSDLQSSIQKAIENEGQLRLAYRASLYGLNDPLRFSTDKGQQTFILKGVDDKGRVVIEDAGVRRSLHHGEVRIVMDL